MAQASLDFADLQGAKRYNGWQAYARSKQANILFTRELSRRLGATGVTANCFHPGAVATRFGDSAGGFTGFMLPIARRLFLTPDKGADTLVYLVSSPEVANVTGGYFVKRKVAEPSAAARDDDAARRLWEASEKLAEAAA